MVLIFFFYYRYFRDLEKKNQSFDDDSSENNGDFVNYEGVEQGSLVQIEQKLTLVK